MTPYDGVVCPNKVVDLKGEGFVQKLFALSKAVDKLIYPMGYACYLGITSVNGALEG